MSIAQRQDLLRLPTTLEAQLLGFRRRVWTIKMAEAAFVAVFAVVVAFLCVFAVDRLWDTPWWLRMAAFLGALCGCAIVPYYLHRWIWRRRHLEQLARLLSGKLPHLGDQGDLAYFGDAVRRDPASGAANRGGVERQLLAGGQRAKSRRSGTTYSSAHRCRS